MGMGSGKGEECCDVIGCELARGVVGHGVA